jgi:hypothetical protein
MSLNFGVFFIIYTNYRENKYMPITTPPPVVVPSPLPPQEIVQKQTQDQTQGQNQDNTTNIGQLDQNQSTKSDADSVSDSSSSQSSTLSNIQVNSNSNRIEYGSFRIPETTLTISGFANGGESRKNDYGVVLGVNVPLGGGVRKSVRRALDTQVKSDLLAFERSYASVCANLEGEGYNINNRSGNLDLLKNCRTDVIKRNVLPPAPPVITPPAVIPPVSNNSEIEELKRQNAELRILLAQLAEKLDKNTPIPGGS